MNEFKKIRETEEETYTSLQYAMIVDGVEIGWANILVDDNGAYCERIDIAEDRRNHGYGTAFLQALSSEFGSIFVAPDNEGAQRLYDRLGYDVSDKDDWCYVDQGFGVYEI